MREIEEYELFIGEEQAALQAYIYQHEYKVSEDEAIEEIYKQNLRGGFVYNEALQILKDLNKND